MIATKDPKTESSAAKQTQSSLPMFEMSRLEMKRKTTQIVDSSVRVELSFKVRAPRLLNPLRAEGGGESRAGMSIMGEYDECRPISKGSL